jgi:hypothetical protein
MLFLASLRQKRTKTVGRTKNLKLACVFSQYFEVVYDIFIMQLSISLYFIVIFHFKLKEVIRFCLKSDAQPAWQWSCVA